MDLSAFPLGIEAKTKTYKKTCCCDILFSLTLTHASHNGPVCWGSVFTSPWQWLSASQGFLEGVEGLALGKGAVKEEFANLAN